MMHRGEKAEPQLLHRGLEAESSSEQDFHGPDEKPIDDARAIKALRNKTKYFILPLGLEKMCCWSQMTIAELSR